jgi:hypothetical protein
VRHGEAVISSPSAKEDLVSSTLFGRRRGIRGVGVTAAVLFALIVAVSANVQAFAGQAGGPGSVQQFSAGTYIVQTSGAPIATYNGGVTGLRATKPLAGRKVNVAGADARAYDGHLRGQHRDVLRKAGIADRQRVYDYTTAFNGFAAKLSAAQAAALARTPGVVRLWRDKIRVVQLEDRDRDLSRAAAAAKRAATPRAIGESHAGEGLIVGVIDTGIWPEHPSFASLPEPRLDAAAIAAKWHGTCDPGVSEPKIVCNNKVIGARYYRSPEISPVPQEFDSPRDYLGHGTSTAGIAAGRSGVEAAPWGAPAGTVSGVAPAARIAAYKVIWDVAGDSNGAASTADIIAAINNAVGDGVDVINYSMTNYRDGAIEPEALAWLNAAEAGVFVSAAASNDGPGGTVHNAAPWVTTVAAARHEFGTDRTVTLGNGAVYAGKGTGDATPATALVDAEQVPAEGFTAADAALCKAGSLDPAKVAGKVVLCTRGVNLRTEKAATVKAAGGVGMVLGDPWSLLYPLFYVVPTVHVDAASLTAIKAYLGEAGAEGTASLSGKYRARAPEIARFSSDGPAFTGGGDVLKPDIAAPGDEIVAPTSPGQYHGDTAFDYNSGTSFSAPYIAGKAALLKARYPGWSPAAIRSALMTTATQTDNEDKPIQRSGKPATPLDYGAGHVVADRAFDPGLVYDSNATQWRAWACGIGLKVVVDGTDFCATAGTLDPSDLNYPSIAVGDLHGTQTITRTVTNVTNRGALYRSTIKAPAGFRARVKPAVLVVRAGKSATFTVQVTRTTAPYSEYAFGALTWRDHRGHVVRSPIAVKPVALSVPAEVAGTGMNGSTELSLRAGYSGKLKATAAGLVRGQERTVDLSTDAPQFDVKNPAASARALAVDMTVPADGRLARFETFAADHPAGTDVDLVIYRKSAAGGLTLAGMSGGPTASEQVTVTESGDYTVFVVLWSAASTTVPTKYVSYMVGRVAENLTVAPATQRVKTNAAATVTVSWQGLSPDAHWLGAVVYSDGTAERGMTTVSVGF